MGAAKKLSETMSGSTNVKAQVSTGTIPYPKQYYAADQVRNEMLDLTDRLKQLGHLLVLLETPAESITADIMIAVQRQLRICGYFI